MSNEFQNPGREEMERRLWEYIDGLATAEETSVIERLIRESQEWKRLHQELSAVHEMMADSPLEEPSLRFTKNVMEEIARLQINPAARNYINKRVVWGIAGFFVATIIGFIIYSVGLVEWSAGASDDSRYTIPVEQVDYMKVFTSNSATIFMMVNIILGLFLLDRYLSARRKKFSEES